MLIGISGKAQVGKDTVCKIIQCLTAYKSDIADNVISRINHPQWVLADYSPFINKKFALKVKEIASILTGIPLSDFEKEEIKNSTLGIEWTVERMPKLMEGPKGADAHYDYFKSPLTVREVLQLIGTECMRDGLHEDVWVNALFSEYKAHKMDEYYPSNWIITDVRFRNELEAIKERGGILIRVNRNTENTTYSHHYSEVALDNYKDWDFIIDNSGDIPQLIEKVRELLKTANILKNA